MCHMPLVIHVPHVSRHTILDVPHASRHTCATCLSSEMCHMPLVIRSLSSYWMCQMSLHVTCATCVTHDIYVSHMTCATCVAYHMSTCLLPSTSTSIWLFTWRVVAGSRSDTPASSAQEEGTQGQRQARRCRGHHVEAQGYAWHGKH